jgi:hypothetical protein
MFDRATQKFVSRNRSTRPARTAAGLKTRLLLQPLEERAVPTVYTVNALTDSGTGSGTTGDLRYCITQANADAATPHTINITATGTINLASALPSITKAETFVGPGASSLTINANNVSRIFNVSSSNPFEIDNMTITGGRVSGPGGGIDGSVSGVNITVKNSVISGCSASSAGGGIYFDIGGSLNVQNSSIVGNSTGSGNGGGGIYFYGSASSYTISNSTIANNTAPSGGGLSFTNFTGTANITSTTITGNTATTASTGLTNGGGGMVRKSGGGSVTLDNSIVSGNNANPTNGYNDFAFSGTVSSYYSALGSTTGITTYTDNGFNVVGGTLNLGTLTSATGPNGTFPMVKPGTGSAAIDAGDPAQNGTTDQLGTIRPLGSGVDMGSFETAPAGIPTASATTSGVTSAGASATYTFTVTYNDTTAVNYASINGNNSAVTVTPPGVVPPVTVTFVSATPTNNATSITATYQFTAPGGAWDPSDNGSYTVNMAANQVKNTGNVYVPAGQIGTFNVNVASPTATATTHNVTQPSPTEPPTYTFTVTYADAVNMVYSSINGNNNAVTVTGNLIGGGTVNPTVTFVSATPTNNATSITATYSFTAPGGTWDGADNGSYVVAVAGNQVQNVNGSYVQSGTAGTFTVGVPLVLTVTDPGDAGVGSGTSGDLRYCITTANANASAPNQIVFSNTTNGGTQTNFYDGSQYTIYLSGTELVLSSNISIVGPGSNVLTVNGGGVSRVFDAPGSTALTIGISGMHLTAGNGGTADGGAINNQTSNMTLTDVLVDGSTAAEGGGVNLNGAGTISLINSTVTGNAVNTTFGDAGGINIQGGGNIVLTNSTVSGNSAADAGGGMYFNVGGSLQMTGSTISGNTANGVGGGFYWYGSVNGNGFNLTNSTIANNQSGGEGGGIVLHSFSAGTMTVKSCTFTGNVTASNGGGISDSGGGTVSLNNSIVAGNTAAGSGQDIYSTSTVTSTYDALGTSAGFTYVAGTGDLPVGASLALQPLANVTGPNGTRAMVALGAGSAAIDAGDPAQGGAGHADEVGTSRPQGAGVDIGAFEKPLTAIPSASATTSGVTSAGASATYTFTVTYADMTAMNYASINGNNNAVTVTTPFGVSPVTVTYVSATPTSNAATIVATYQFTAPGGAWDPSDNGSYTVNMAASQVKDTNNNYVPAGQIGAFTVNVASPTAAGTTHNVTQASPGEPPTYTFTVTYADAVNMVYSSINGNNSAVTVTGNLTGGGTVNPAVTFVSATPNANANSITATYSFTAPGGTWDGADNGGYVVAVAANQVKNVNNTYVPAGTVGTFTVSVPRILTVTDTGDAGVGSGDAGDLRYCMTVAAADAPAPDAIVFSNTTNGGTQTNFYDGSQYTITLFSALPTVTGPLTITGSGASVLTIDAAGSGRVFTDSAPSFSLSGLTLTGGAVSGYGGAIKLTAGNENLTITNSVITGNSSSSGGGAIYNLFGGTVTITGSTISNNISGGGAIWMNQNSTGGGALVLTNSSVANNLSTGQGGALGFYWGGPLTVTSSSITGNSASGIGGGAYFYGNGGTANYPININNSTIANNTAGSGGGGAFSLDTGNGSFTATNSTFTGNVTTGAGGVIDVINAATSTITLHNSIFAGNTATSAAAISTTTTVNSSYDAIDDQTGFTYVAGTGDLSAANSTTTALNLQPLANATGPNGTFMVAALGAGSTALDVGDPALGGSGQTDEIGTPRPQGAGVDIGAVETPVTAPPPHIGSVVVGSGAQRSEVRSITITFDTAVTFTGGNSNAAAAFQLLHTIYDTTTYNTQVNNLQAAVSTNGSGQTVVTLTFTTTGNAATEVDPLSVQSTAGGPTTPSLGDGRYTLTILASNVSGPGGALAGNGTTAGTNYVSSSTSGPNNYGDIYRVFGDSTGEGIVDLTDLGNFRNTYNTALGNAAYVNALDADNDAVIDLDDLTAFRNHYNHHV